MDKIPEGNSRNATVVTADAAGCARLIDALAAAGYAATVRGDVSESLPGGTVCLDTRAWLASGRHLEELARANLGAAPGAATALLLLFDCDGHAAGAPDEGFRRTVRAIANGLAPAARVNAIIAESGAEGVASALRLILGSPAMTGQTLRLSARPVPGFRPSLEGMPPPAEAAAPIGPGFRRMFIRDLVLSAYIGVHRHEKAGRQRVRLNVDLDVAEDAGATGDRLTDVVCYETMANRIRAATCSGHVNLVETLAERIAEICLSDPRVARAKVRIEKLDIFPDAVSAGVEIERRQIVP